MHLATAPTGSSGRAPCGAASRAGCGLRGKGFDLHATARAAGMRGYPPRRRAQKKQRPRIASI